jgi:membrane protein implicated in regulation of membrane protease activity
VITTLLVIAVVASVAVVLATLLDGILDAIDLDLPGDGGLSTIGLCGGVAAFGWTGVIVATTTTWALPGVLLSGAAVGLVVLVGVSALMRALRSRSGDEEPRGLVGAAGTVVAPVAPGVPGLVRVTYQGALRTVTAHSEQALEPGAAVVVDRAATLGEVHVSAPQHP